MEVVEEAEEIAEEVGEEVGEEAAEEAAEEEVAEEVAEARENVGRLRGCINTLKEVNWGQVVKSFVKFVAKNVAVGAILWGVTVALNKAIKQASGHDKEEIEKKQKKITALARLTSDISNCFKNLAHWFEEKKDVTIDVGDGIMVPLPDVFTKYTKPMEKYVDIIFDVAKEMWSKDDSGKKVFVVPTTDQVNKIINSSAPILEGLQDMITFANSKKEKFPELGTLPIKQYDVDKLNGDVEKIKELPYA